MLAYLIFSIVFAFIMGIAVIIIRMKAQNFQLMKKIILPPFLWLQVPLCM